MKNTHQAVRFCQFILVLPTFLLTTSCSTTPKNKVVNKSNDTISHGYNELANASNLKSIPISDYNTDNPEIANIERPQTSTVDTKLDTAALFHSWTKDPDGPCTDFVISKETFYIADYDGDGAMPYELIDKKLKIYYNDFIQEGEIVSVTNDTLKIHWKGMDEITNFVRWTQ
jgi:hypothetical protein